MLTKDQIIKYILEGIAVSVASVYLTKKNHSIVDIVSLGLVASITFMVLDMFAPSVSLGARQGTGFGIGYNLVGGNPNNEDGNMVQGQYCTKSLRATDSDNVLSFNSIPNKYSSRPADWVGAKQTGGAPDEGETEPEPKQAPPKQDPSTESATVMTDNPNHHRIADALYSGDLINLSHNGNYVQR